MHTKLFLPWLLTFKLTILVDGEKLVYFFKADVPLLFWLKVWYFIFKGHISLKGNGEEVHVVSFGSEKCAF